ncbi:MAG: selenide, water dikinase SelD, partial [Acidimicrobiales bacterium]
MSRPRLTELSSGGGCSCKISAGELERLLAVAFPGADALAGSPPRRVLVGLEAGDDATVVELDPDRAIVTTTDFFPPIVDDPFDWGRIAAANALSDIYAMGAEPLSALNLLCWPGGDVLSDEVAGEVLRGGVAVCAKAGCILAGGHSIRGETPLYGLAVTGLADPAHLLRIDAAVPGDPITLTKAIGVGILANRFQQTGDVASFAPAVASMTELNREASHQALDAGVLAATDVTGFGLLGHLAKMARASGVTAVVDSRAVPVIEGARAALDEGYVPGGSRRNLEWVLPSLQSEVSPDQLLLLADAQTSGGLLIAGEI